MVEERPTRATGRSTEEARERGNLGATPTDRLRTNSLILMLMVGMSLFGLWIGLDYVFRHRNRIHSGIMFDLEVRRGPNGIQLHCPSASRGQLKTVSLIRVELMSQFGNDAIPNWLSLMMPFRTRSIRLTPLAIPSGTPADFAIASGIAVLERQLPPTVAISDGPSPCTAEQIMAMQMIGERKRWCIEWFKAGIYRAIASILWLTITVSTIWWWKRVKQCRVRFQRLRSGACVKCGYSNVIERRCPECGEPAGGGMFETKRVSS